MVDIGALLPVTTIGGVIAILINAVIVWIILMIVGKVILKTLDAKRTFILALVALFLAPIVVAFVALPAILSVYVIPLVVWIVLGEILLKGGKVMDKLKVIVIAFVVYIVLNFVGVAGMLSSLIPL